MEQYQNESVNLNILREDKKTFIIDKYNKKINSVIEEDNDEDENELNDNKKNSRITSQFVPFNISDRRDDEKII